MGCLCAFSFLATKIQYAQSQFLNYKLQHFFFFFFLKIHESALKSCADPEGGGGGGGPWVSTPLEFENFT